MTASANAPPPLTARAASRSSSPFMRKALRFIQMIIVVTKTTAIAPMTVSSISCWRWGSEAETTSNPAPTAMLMATANPTPMTMGRTGLSLRLRKAPTMLTMSVASRPSRSPMRNVPTKMPCTFLPSAQAQGH